MVEIRINKNWYLSGGMQTYCQNSLYFITDNIQEENHGRHKKRRTQ